MSTRLAPAAALPWTTTITVLRAPDSPTVDPGTDPPPAEETLASGVRAHIGSPRGSESPPVGGGEQSTVTWSLHCEPVDGFDHRCTVTDETTGERYRVTWAARRTGLGLDHCAAALVQVVGEP